MLFFHQFRGCRPRASGHSSSVRISLRLTKRHRTGETHVVRHRARLDDAAHRRQVRAQSEGGGPTPNLQPMILTHFLYPCSIRVSSVAKRIFISHLASFFAPSNRDCELYLSCGSAVCVSSPLASISAFFASSAFVASPSLAAMRLHRSAAGQHLPLRELP